MASKKQTHYHLFERSTLDPRFDRCSCGETRRRDRDDQNPCAQWWGDGPKGTTCGGCAHLRMIQMATTYYKCDQRHGLPVRAGGLTHSAATDQRLSWPSCARYTPRASAPQFASRYAGVHTGELEDQAAALRRRKRAEQAEQVVAAEGERGERWEREHD